MTAPLSNRAALEAASSALREGQLPSRARAHRIAATLDAMALAIALGTEPVGAIVAARPQPRAEVAA